MTPKEKAIELIRKFTKLEIEIGGQFDGYLTMNIYDAKQCALIAVDELIRDNVQNEKLVNEILNKKFWQQVKTEIENL